MGVYSPKEIEIIYQGLISKPRRCNDLSWGLLSASRAPAQKKKKN
jgi:hypothetical protein